MDGLAKLLWQHFSVELGMPCLTGAMTRSIPHHPLLSFYSGMSAKSDLLGAMDAGVPIGVVADKITTASLALSIPSYLDRGGHVFIDSGAFHREASPDWPMILDRYAFIANLTDRPENLYVVAPDVVGDQEASLQLLEAWRTPVRALIARGVQVIVPIQSGKLTAQDVRDHLVALLQTERFTIGIPSNRAALSITDCQLLRHARFHILGRVCMDDLQVARLEALLEQNPEAIISADANWLRSRLLAVTGETREIQVARRSLRTGCLPLDHPRVEAISNCLRADRVWGASP